MSTDMDGPERPEEFGEYVEFELVEERKFGQSTLECPACGTVFEVDAYKHENLVWDKNQMALVACCPICQRLEK